MRIRYKGLNFTNKRLADGSTRTYWYAWRGGPLLTGEPGTPEFEQSWQEAAAQKAKAPEGTLQSLFDYFQTTTEFTNGIEERTRADYRKIIQRTLEPKFATFPIKALADPRSRGVFKDWRDELALKSLRRADYAWTVLARILSVAADRGKIACNPCAKGGRLYSGSRKDNIWTDQDEATFLAGAPAHLHLPLLLGLWTGQRQCDLPRLPWSAYDGKYIRLRQSKTGALVVILAGKPLKAALDQAAKHKRGPLILTNLDGQPWKQFGSYFGKVTKRLGITGLTFHDMRGSAVTRLFLAGSTEAEVATLTGHSLANVRAILDRHYFHRDVALGDSAIRKLEAAHENKQA
jgi:integrase